MLKYTEITAKFKKIRDKKKNPTIINDTHPGIRINPKIFITIEITVKINNKKDKTKLKNDEYKRGL